MVRQGIINRINKYAKNRGLKVIEIKEVEEHYNRGYKFNKIEFTTTGGWFLFYEMDCNKRHWFII